MEDYTSVLWIVGLLGASLAFGAVNACGGSPRVAAEGDAVAATECLPLSDDERAAIAFPTSPGNTPDVDVAWVYAHRCNVRVVDVREAEERVSGQVEHAMSVALTDLPDVAAEWNPRDPVVLVCRSGRRSARGVEQLESMGFTRAASMTGGMLMWAERSLPLQVERDAQRTSFPGLPSPPPQFMRPDPAEHQSIHALLEETHIPLTRVASLLLQNSEACVDGRETHGIVGTPGGDAGELLLALASIEQLAMRELSEREIRDVFEAHVANFGRFYVHTDSHAMSALRRRLPSSPELANDESNQSASFEAYLRSPPRRDEDAILRHIAEPSTLGCGHLRLVLQHPIEYGVRPGLTRTLIRVVFRELWRHPEHVSFVVLYGDHHEEAVLNVRLGSAACASSNVPAVPPQIGGRSFFVNHPEVSQYIRKEHVALLRRELSWLEPLGSEANLEGVISALAERQLGSTLRYLARALPVYDVYFDNGGVRVTAAAVPSAESVVAR